MEGGFVDIPAGVGIVDPNPPEIKVRQDFAFERRHFKNGFRFHKVFCDGLASDVLVGHHQIEAIVVVPGRGCFGDLHRQRTSQRCVTLGEENICGGCDLVWAVTGDETVDDFICACIAGQAGRGEQTVDGCCQLVGSRLETESDFKGLEFGAVMKYRRHRYADNSQRD